MLDRTWAGELPKKHHIALRSSAGDLRHEECLTRKGFDGPYSLLYHLHRPHLHELVPEPAGGWELPQADPPGPLRKRHFRSSAVENQGGAPSEKRHPMLFNEDVVSNVLMPDADDPTYVVNGDGDDIYFIFEGGGVLRSVFGDLRFEKNDYVAVPRGVIHRFLPTQGTAQKWLHIECREALGLLSQWRTDTGQLRMDAPYCHRDFRKPEFQGPVDEGIREVLVKRRDRFDRFRIPESPLDVVGWDGSVYPWVFPILNFQPRAGLVHLPPDWHGTFSTRGALICSFVPRMVDFHEDAIPCPYPHSSVDCDEMLFYVSGNFTSRKGVGPGSISFHPAGIPHGPHPGSYENSIGGKKTNELAVMMDTFRPLNVSAAAVAVEDTEYMRSFA